MRIKSLKISGFKSFCHPVEIEFKQHGITVVVGPNGCGKSNVVDAIRWVLGEQSAKHLRGGAMEDVIFSGSAFQKPSGVAEVTLSFSNLEGDTIPKYQEYTEIAITRRLYRSGESVYMINKTPVRLMDIKELFMDTGIGGKGYSIIEQGKIGSIVSAKPSERRHIIEEVAGIVKFQSKRQNAERKLEQTEQNLERVSDILRELENQEATLGEQAKKADYYTQVLSDYQRTDQQLGALKWKKASEQERLYSTRSHEGKALEEQLQKDRAVQAAALETLSREQDAKEKELEQLRQQTYETEKQAHALAGQKQLQEQNLLNAQEWISKHHQEIEELESQQQNSTEEQGSYQAQAEGLSEQKQLLEQEIQNIEETQQRAEDELFFLNEDLQSSQQALLGLHTDLTNNENQKGFVEERIHNLQERNIKLQQQLAAGQKLLEDASEQVQATQSRVEHIEETCQNVQEHLLTLEQQDQSFQEQIDILTQEFENTQYQYHAESSQIESLTKIQKQLEDFDDTVKSFFQCLDEHPGKKEEFEILGIFAEYVHIQPDNLKRVSAAMADYLESVVIKHAEKIPQIEAFIKENDLGQVSFLALDHVETDEVHRPQHPNISGTPLCDWLELDPTVEVLRHHLFKNIFVLDDAGSWETVIHANSEQEAWNHEYVSPDGSYLTYHQVAKIGMPQTASIGFLERQNQIEALLQSVETLKQTLENQKQQRDAITQEKEQLALEIKELQAQKHEHDVELSHFKKELEHNLLEQGRNRHTVSQLESDQSLLFQEVEHNQKRLQDIIQNIEDLQTKRTNLEKEMSTNQVDTQEKQKALDELSKTILVKRVTLTETSEQLKTAQATYQRLKQEHETLQSRLQHLNAARESSELNIDKCQESIQQLAESHAALLGHHEQLKEKLEAEDLAYRGSLETRTEQNKKLQEVNRQLEELLLSSHEIEIKITEHRLQREQLEEQLQATYEKHPKELVKVYDLEHLNETRLSGTLRNLKAQLNEMSSINMAAPEEYKLLLERMELLQKQSSDLEQAIEDLKATIREINTESRKRFKESFELVNQQFKNTFVQLFGGGEAHMVLTDSDDVLEAGIDIIAQPPGKRLQNLNLLSGGEKALTALSLIFSIYLIKPSPFCLLDEVDAPLDDANVGRFNSMIKKLTDDSQFIIITHNKKTMEIGHLLYGVTMEEAGISKTVSVEFEEAHQMVA